MIMTLPSGLSTGAGGSQMVNTTFCGSSPSHTVDLQFSGGDTTSQHSPFGDCLPHSCTACCWHSPSPVIFSLPPPLSKQFLFCSLFLITLTSSLFGPKPVDSFSSQTHAVFPNFPPLCVLVLINIHMYYYLTVIDTTAPAQHSNKN